MRVLNISSVDYANMAHENANALRAVGVDCDDFTNSSHVFQYKSASTRVDLSYIKEHYKEYDVIQLFHSCPVLYTIVYDHPNVIVYHTGTRYRQDKQRYDKLFNGRDIFTDQCEFLLHNESFKYIAPHVTLTKKIKPLGSKLRIAHYPSNYISKGTKDIQLMLRQFNEVFNIDINTNKEPHDINLRRIAQCDIYIELFKPDQDGKPYGCFGVTAFEATALGCLVITNNVNRKAYEDVYGSHSFLIPNTKQEFVNMIASLAEQRNTFEYIRDTMHTGFMDKHGIIPTGNRIKQLINESIQR
jgi:hypothetical protein